MQESIPGGGTPLPTPIPHPAEPGDWRIVESSVFDCEPPSDMSTSDRPRISSILCGICTPQVTELASNSPQVLLQETVSCLPRRTSFSTFRPRLCRSQTQRTALSAASTSSVKTSSPPPSTMTKKKRTKTIQRKTKTYSTTKKTRKT